MSLIRLLGGGLLEGPTLRLEGERVALRPPEARDWAAWAALRARSRAFLTPWEPAWPADTLSRSSFTRRVRRQLADWRDDLTYSFLSFERGGETLVGGLGLGNIRRGVSQTATLGYWVGEPFARKGYTTDAVARALDYGFDELDLHRVEASCLPDNQASRGLLHKLGFTCEGMARGYLRIEGEWRDHLIYALLKDDWRPSRKKPAL